MPIGLRDLAGRRIPVPIQAYFVEITAADDKLAAVLINNPNGMVIFAKPGDPEFEMYQRSVGMHAAKHIPLYKPKEG